MSARQEHRDLGMDRRIPGRDFRNGIAIGITGASVAGTRAGAELLAAQPPAGPATSRDPSTYPPAHVGLRGNYPSSIEDFGPLRDQRFTKLDAVDVDTREDYDLVIVGGGLSGLAAAYFWRRALPNQRALIIDNHDDFGGHAKRNEFTYNGRTSRGH